VDVSWNESWNGTEQVRHFKIEDGRLIVATAPGPSIIHPGKTSFGRLVFERENEGVLELEREGVMLRKKKEAKAKRSILETLLRDMQGTSAEKLALFERLKAAGAFVNESAAELAEAEKTLRAFAARRPGD